MKKTHRREKQHYFEDTRPALGDSKRETGDGRQEARDRKWETGGGRQETGSGRQETVGGRRVSNVISEKCSTYNLVGEFVIFLGNANR